MDKSHFLCYDNTIIYERVDPYMSFSLLPKVMADAVTDLTPEWLTAHGIRLLMLDFDNTIVPYTTDLPSAQMEQWLRQMLMSDIQICVVSNSKKQRVRIFCQKYSIPCITHAAKPFSRGIRQCLEQFQIPAEACALAGDQIFTDTLGANCMGVKSVLVRAICNHNFLLKARHAAEMPFIWAASRRRLPRS